MSGHEAAKQPANKRESTTTTGRMIDGDLGFRLV
jgi:hypothetical protein